MVALVTDSTSQLPDTTRAALDVQVVPITVVVDGQPYQEGIDLDADGFYALFAGGRQPEISTSQPSPGTFVEAYQRCIDAGHDEILSIHVTEALSGTLNSARIAAGMVDATVHLVDSRTASYGVTCAQRSSVMDERRWAQPVLKTSVAPRDAQHHGSSSSTCALSQQQ